MESTWANCWKIKSWDHFEPLLADRLPIFYLRTREWDESNWNSNLILLSGLVLILINIGTHKNENNSDKTYVKPFKKINTKPHMFDNHNSPLTRKLSRHLRVYVYVTKWYTGQSTMHWSQKMAAVTVELSNSLDRTLQYCWLITMISRSVCFTTNPFISISGLCSWYKFQFIWQPCR